MSDDPITGGCQCGAVRYQLAVPPTNTHLCHCRMCQKAFGSYFAPLGNVPLTQFQITRGAIATFRSSDLVERGFCRDCGTPLTFRYLKGVEHISIALGSLDRPERAKPNHQFGTEARMPWFAELAALPGKQTEEWAAAIPGLADSIRSSNHQHPDHDS